MKELEKIAPEDRIFSDETGIDNNEVVITGWAPKGKRLYAKKRAVRSARLNIIAERNFKGELFAPLLFEGYCNADIFAEYLQQVLLSSLKPGQALIIDNAAFHKSKKITNLVEQAKCKILYLPPYSPDFNPIEHLWSPLKKKIRTLAASPDHFYDAAVETLFNMCTPQ